jgi:hypothetical protein
MSTEKIVKEEKARIKLMPIFPDHTTFEYIEKSGKKKFTVTSSVRIHFEELWNLEVYLYPVETTAYVKGTVSKRELVLVHLNRCLVLAKYLMVRRETIEGLPLVETLDKKAEDFSEKLWHYFP